MLFHGFGVGIAFNPLLLAVMSDVAPQESALASGVVNTAFMIGGALGLAIVASLAALTARPCSAPTTARWPPSTAAIMSPSSSAAFFAVAAVLGTVLLHASATTAPTDGESAAAPGCDHDPKEAPCKPQTETSPVTDGDRTRDLLMQPRSDAVRCGPS
jgi:MFS family permease